MGTSAIGGFGLASYEPGRQGSLLTLALRSGRARHKRHTEAPTPQMNFPVAVTVPSTNSRDVTVTFGQVTEGPDGTGV